MLIDTPSNNGAAAYEPARPSWSDGFPLQRRTILLLSGVLFFASVVVALGFHMAVQTLRAKIVEALGPGSEVRELKVGWSSVELVGLDIPAPKGWPAARTFYADRVKIVPSLRTLLSQQIEIASIIVENPYVSVVRVPGKLLLLPSLLEAERRQDSGKVDRQNSSRSVSISKIVLDNGTMELFDATVSKPPQKIRLEHIRAVVHDLAPANAGKRIQFELTAKTKGKLRDGEIKIAGWLAAAGKDSWSHVVMKDVELAGLQSYIVKKGDIRIRKGTLDLNLKNEVRKNQLDGAGTMILRDLEFAPAQSYVRTFMGLPRDAVVSFLKNHDNAIDLDFTLSGDIRDVDFSLNETLATRVASGMASQLGVSIQGLAEGVGSLGQRGLEGAAGTADAIGSLFKGLLGGKGNSRQAER